MFAIPAFVLYKSRTNYLQIWISRQQEKIEMVTHPKSEGHIPLVPRREVEFLDQLQIQEVLHDIREAKNKIRPKPMTQISRMMYLRTQRNLIRNQKSNVERYKNTVFVQKESSELPDVEN